MDELELVAVARRDATRGREVASRYGCEHVSDALALADRKDLDLIIVAAAPVVIERVVERTAAGAERVTSLLPTPLVAGTRLRLALGATPT